MAFVNLEYGHNTGYILVVGGKRRPFLIATLWPCFALAVGEMFGGVPDR